MQRILLQFDTDARASVFDRVVAIDAGVEQLFSYGGVTADDVQPLVHGAIFTRGPKDLNHTAIFIGGSRVDDGQAVLKAVQWSFFGPLRCSVMLDSNGSNTTAAAAVLSAGKHVALSGAKVVVLAATGPVGQRAAQLFALEGARVVVTSRSLPKAEALCAAIKSDLPGADIAPLARTNPEALRAACEGVQIIVAAGAAGVELLPQAVFETLQGVQVVIDVNAVPPVGVGGIAATDKAITKNGVICYGALGIGGLKMKIHKAALQRLFEKNDLVLDTVPLYRIGETLL